MTAIATATQSFTTRMVGALLIIAALASGLGVGSLTNDSAPAHADVITQPTQSSEPVTSACTGLCAGTISGNGGTVSPRR